MCEYRLTKKKLTYRPVVVAGNITPQLMLLLDKGKIKIYAFYETLGKARYTNLFVVKSNQVVKVFGAIPDSRNKAGLLEFIPDSDPATAFLNAQKRYNEATNRHTIKICNGEPE